MPRPSDQILTAAQMRAAELEIPASVDELMQRAGRGAAEWVWRAAAGRAVTVLCGPGNNGGDGYVIAEALRERGGEVAVVAATEPKTEAAQTARALYGGEVLAPDSDVHGEVLVDCLYGSGLTRPLWGDDLDLFLRLAARHRLRIAVDLPSGVEADTGALLNPGLPRFDLTIALGAWKFAHFLMPAAQTMGALLLVEIGVEAVAGAARAIARPQLSAPAVEAHKYTRGLLGVIGGAMPGAALLAARAAQQAGAGYVKLFADVAAGLADLVVDSAPLDEALRDPRLSALLIGPGLGRDDSARQRLAMAIARNIPLVLDADALTLLDSGALNEHSAGCIVTPHGGELRTLEQAFVMDRAGSKLERALALAPECGAVIVAKGPDTVVAMGDGSLACAMRASSWLSVAGTGDVLAGTIASRLATGLHPFTAACEGVWLHGEAARLAGPAFTASQLAAMIRSAYAACL